MESTKASLEAVLEYLTPLLPLANSHTVDFIVHDTWTKLVSGDIKAEIQRYGTQCILDNVRNGIDCHLLQFIRVAEKHVIERCAAFENMESLEEKWKSYHVQPIKITEFMTDKKSHEVEYMSKLIATIANICDTDLVVDVGSGKGYLTSVLALQHRLRVLGLDNKKSNINGAVRITTKLERKWQLCQRSSENQKPAKSKMVQIIKEPCHSNEEYYEKYRWRSMVVGNLFKSRVENVFEDTNLKSILHEEYPDEDEHKVVLTGLHTCGNLAASCLRLFVKNQSTVESVVSVGCCYHLIDEKFVNDRPGCRAKYATDTLNFETGFPMSMYLKRKGFSLGRDARMCGTQNPSKVFKDHELISATKPLFYRALLQELLKKSLAEQDLPSGIVGRIAHKCSSFHEYALKAFERLGVSIHMNEEELNLFAEQYNEYWKKLKSFFLMKAALSSVIETVILQDRLLYLYEQNIHDSFVTRLFDPVISPRCYAVIAFKNVNTDTRRKMDSK